MINDTIGAGVHYEEQEKRIVMYHNSMHIELFRSRRSPQSQTQIHEGSLRHCAWFMLAKIIGVMIGLGGLTACMAGNKQHIAFPRRWIFRRPFCILFASRIGLLSARVIGLIQSHAFELVYIDDSLPIRYAVPGGQYLSDVPRHRSTRTPVDSESELY